MIVCDKPGQPQILYSFLTEKSGLPWSTDLRVIGRLRGLAPVAAVGYNSWVDDGVFMHVAFEDPHSFTPELLREAFVYPFDACGKRVVFAMTPISNEVVDRFVKRLGWREVYRNSAFVLSEMTRDECRWINGKKLSSGSAGLHFSGAADRPRKS